MRCLSTQLQLCIYVYKIETTSVFTYDMHVRIPCVTPCGSRPLTNKYECDPSTIYAMDHHCENEQHCG